MIKITIRAYGHLGELLDSRKRNISIPTSTIGGLIDFISKKINPSFKDRIISSQTNDLADSYRILVNGQDIDATGLNTQLYDGDEILFFPPVGGG